MFHFSFLRYWFIPCFAAIASRFSWGVRISEGELQPGVEHIENIDDEEHALPSAFSKDVPGQETYLTIQPPSLGMLIVTSNFAYGVEEFVAHYRAENVSQFVFVEWKDRGTQSTDGWVDLARSLGSDVQVTQADDIQAAGLEIQEGLYHQGLRLFTTEWVGVIDTDEFIYARSPFLTIPQYLATVPSNVSQVSIVWKLFGSNGTSIKQPRSVISHYTTRANPPDGNTNVKSIVRRNALVKFSVHWHEVRGNSILVDGSQHEGYQALHKLYDFSKWPLNLNHHKYQSLEQHSYLKNCRGFLPYSCDSFYAQNHWVSGDSVVRDAEGFLCNVFDDELARKRGPNWAARFSQAKTWPRVINCGCGPFRTH